jgi:cell division protein FtsB
MNAHANKREKRMQLFALGWLLVLGALALVGPYGMLSWGEQSALLEKRQDTIAALEEERSALENRVELLDPDHVDPDLAGELMRQNLNVAHPDEYVVDLEMQP